MLCIRFMRAYPEEYVLKKTPQYPVCCDRCAAQSDDCAAETDHPGYRAFGEYQDMMQLLVKDSPPERFRGCSL